MPSTTASRATGSNSSYSQVRTPTFSDHARPDSDTCRALALAGNNMERVGEGPNDGVPPALPRHCRGMPSSTPYLGPEWRQAASSPSLVPTLGIVPRRSHRSLISAGSPGFVSLPFGAFTYRNRADAPLSSIDCGYDPPMTACPPFPSPPAVVIQGQGAKGRRRNIATKRGSS